MKKVNELKGKVNYLNNQLKQSKMNNLVNKFVLGLSCLGALLVVSCDNDHTEPKTAPVLKEANLSANMTSKGIKAIVGTGKAYVKLSITTDESGTNYAKYYKTNNEQTGLDLKDINFPIQKDGSIKTFFLKATESGQKYWVQKFNIYDNDPSDSKTTLQYSLSKISDFTLKTGVKHGNIPIDVVKNESSDTESSTDLQAPSFSTQTVEGYSFQVGFLNSLKQWFRKSDDYKINFAVKHVINSTTSEQYRNEDIFGEATDVKTNLMQINMPRSKEYYEKGKFEVVAIVKRTVADSEEHQFNTVGSDAADTQIKAGGLILKIKNTFPIIKVNGADGSNTYSDANKTFNLTSQTNAVTIFETSDADNDPLTNTYTWALYKDETEITTAYIGSNKISSYSNPSITPSTLKISQNTTLSSQGDLDIYTLRVTAKADDGLGGITEETVEFNVKKN